MRSTFKKTLSQAVGLPLYVCIGYLLIENMGKMNIVIEDDIEERFRRTVANSKGFRKGNISIALQEAMELWIKEQTRHKSKDGE
ncbi:MAG: hypothetical protein WAM42_03030 [Candidatus Nitrosopolaris sp.]